MTATYATSANLKSFMGFDDTTSPFTDVQLQNALNIAEVKINQELMTSFVDGTTATPAYTQVTEEEHRGKGPFDRDYFARRFPIASVSTSLSADVATTDTTINVTSTNGFASSGHFFVDGDKIKYTGKTSNTFTGVTEISSAHDEGDDVLSYGIEISVSGSGATPTWLPVYPVRGYNVDFDRGRFHLYKDIFIADPYGSMNPPKIPDRVRMTYLTGRSSIPDDIEWLCMAMASRDLMRTAVRKAHATGLNDYNPELLDIDNVEIERILNRYRSFQMSNIH